MPLVDSTTGELIAPDIETLVAAKRDADERNGVLQEQMMKMSREIARLKGERTKAAGEDPQAAAVREVLEFWRDDLGHKRAKIPLDGERAKKARARLNDGYTVDELKRALELAEKDPYFVEHGYNDPKTIFRDTATKYLKLAVEGGPEPKHAVVRKLDERRAPVVKLTPFDRAYHAIIDEFGRGRCEVIFDREGPPDYLLGRIAFVMAPCPIRPHQTDLTMRLAEHGPAGRVRAACKCGHTEEELLDAIRALELRADRRREEAVSFARAAAA